MGVFLLYESKDIKALSFVTVYIYMYCIYIQILQNISFHSNLVMSKITMSLPW